MDWIYTSADALPEILGGCILLFIVVIFLTRIVGLRSFAKFTSYDFAFTVAIGSIISAILTSSTTVVEGSVAIGGLLGLTWLFSTLQRKYSGLDKLISNTPLLLMEEGEILHDNLAHARIDHHQLIAKLREANVLHYGQVCAVVLENTGDISVLHRGPMDEDDAFDPSLLEGVRRTP